MSERAGEFRYGGSAGFLERARLVVRLAWRMLCKLEKPSNRRKQHWRNAPVGYLVQRVEDELMEFQQSGWAWDEAADLANIAAMLADRVVDDQPDE